MAASVRWSEKPDEAKESQRSYPYNASGGAFNESKGPRLFSCVSPTLGDEQLAPDHAPLCVGDASYDSHTPGYNDAMNMSSQISMEMTKHWTRESASNVKRWDNEVGHNRNAAKGIGRASPDRYLGHRTVGEQVVPGIRELRKNLPMGIMPPPGAAAALSGISPAGRHLKNRYEEAAEEAWSAQAAQVQPEPEPEPAAATPLPPSSPGEPSSDLQTYLATEGSPTGSDGAATAPADAAQSVSFEPASLAKAKASLAPEPGQRDMVVQMATTAVISGGLGGGGGGGGGGIVAHGRRRGSPTKARVVKGRVHQSTGVQRKKIEVHGRGSHPLGNENHYADRRAAQFGGPKQASAWAAPSGCDRFGRSKTTRQQNQEELLAGPRGTLTWLSPARRKGRAPEEIGFFSPGPAVVVHKA